ncbi:hypothetical protein PFISCL1PPCAC_22251, partial [Pristionchus fissidentatus]
PYLACLIDNYWSFTGGKRIYKDGKHWFVEYSNSQKWKFHEKDAFNVSCKPAEMHSSVRIEKLIFTNITHFHTHRFDICNSVPRLGNGLIVTDSFGCVDGYDWNYARPIGGESFHEKPVCTEGGWQVGSAVLQSPINEMWCKPRSTANPNCGSIRLDDKAYCTPKGYRCADNFLPYLSCYINNYWSYTGGLLIFKRNRKWVVKSSNDEYSFDEQFAHNITCIYNGKPSHAPCRKAVPRFGSAYLAGDTYNCITGFEWNYAMEVDGKLFNCIPFCQAGGWTVNGTLLTKPIKEMWCKPV